MPANFANPGGYWESCMLAAENDRLLRLWSSTWWRPPGAVTHEMLTHLADQRLAAAKVFSDAFGDEPGWVWKDPRLTVLLPFWAPILGDTVVLVPIRDPVATAVSISRRDGFSLEQSLAIVETHTRLLLQALEGRRALIADYERLVADPNQWCSQLYDFAAQAGLPVGDPQTPPDDLVDVPCRLTAERPPGRATPEQMELYQMLAARAGPHLVFPPLDPPPVSPGTLIVMESIGAPSWARPPLI